MNRVDAKTIKIWFGVVSILLLISFTVTVIFAWSGPLWFFKGPYYQFYLSLFLFLSFQIGSAIVCTLHFKRQVWKPGRWAWIMSMFGFAAVLIPLPIIAYCMINILPAPKALKPPSCH